MESQFSGATMAIGFGLLAALMAVLYVEAFEKGKKITSVVCGCFATVSILIFLYQSLLNCLQVNKLGACYRSGRMELRLLNKVQISPQEIIVHEGGHYLFPHSGLLFTDEGRLHPVIHAMGLLRCLELNQMDRVNEYAKYPSTEKYAQLSKKAFELGRSLNNPQAAWDFLRLMAEGKTEEEAAGLGRG